MSDAAVKEFKARMSADETFRAKVMGLNNMDERMKLINSEGFDCTAEEVAAASTELSEEELDMVVGCTNSFVPKLNISMG
jgi:predicted ribosomally synthesized peptide with nif11-like leader